MSIRLRNGSLHYQFAFRGVNYSGNCETLDEEEAKGKERIERERLTQAAALVNKPAVLRKFVESEISVLRLRLEDVFSYFEKKPRKKRLTPKSREEKLGVWSDFLNFLNKSHPAIRFINDVGKIQAEQYIGYIQLNGRFEKEVSYVGKNGTAVVYRSKGKLSDRSCNKYLIFLREIFSKISDDCGIEKNPFGEIPTLVEKKLIKVPFEDDELQRIFAEGSEFVTDLFTVILYTGLREGDGCTLAWEETFLDKGIIVRKFRKTDFIGVIPILPPLREFLLNKKKTSTSKFVLPKHAATYLKDYREVGKRVKYVLNSLEIKNTVKAESGNNVSIKDVHSLRHNFCYKAMQANMPLAILMSIVGHEAIEMSLHYQKHVKATEALTWMAKMDFGVEE